MNATNASRPTASLMPYRTPLNLALFVATVALAAGCVNPEGGHYTAAPGASPTPSPRVPTALGCEGEAATDVSLPPIIGPLHISTVAMAAFHAPAVTADEVVWVGCGPDSEGFRLTSYNWAGVQFESAGSWRLTAIVDGEAVAQGTFEVTSLGGDVVRFDAGQTSSSSPAELGALPWPSELYRDATHHRILLSKPSLEAAIPDAMYGLMEFLVPGLRSGWTTMNGFSVTPGMMAMTESDSPASVDNLESYAGPAAFTEVGAAAFLIELVDGEVVDGARRIPLVWRYQASFTAELTNTEDPDGPLTTVDFPRNALSMWLPPGQTLQEDTEYLWILTTGLGGAQGPWRAAEGFTQLINYPRSLEAEEVETFRERVKAAVAVLPDLPDLGVVAGAAHFKTQRFSDQLEAVADCALSNRCGGLEMGEGGWPEASPTFDSDHVYLADPPAGSPYRSIAELMGEPSAALTGGGVVTPVVDACDRRYPYEDYQVVAFGSVPSPSFLQPDPSPLVEPPTDDIFVESDSGRLRLGPDGARSPLRFSLIIPKAEPVTPEGYPVVVFVHGLSQDQSDVFKVAEYLAPFGVALLAVDQPSHGSRYELDDLGAEEEDPCPAIAGGPDGSCDQLNNVWMLEAAYLRQKAEASSGTTAANLEDQADALERAAGAFGPDGLDDAKTQGFAYTITSILSSFKFLRNFKGMGDSTRQLSVDLMQVERMLANANGLNSALKRWDRSIPPLKVGAPYYHGRSLGSIALGVHLGALSAERTAVLGVPGAGVGAYLAAGSPFVGGYVLFVEDLLACIEAGECQAYNNYDWSAILGGAFPSPVGQTYLAPGDPFTHLIQGLIEAGDPMGVVARHRMDGASPRTGPAHLLLQHVCDDEVLPNAATEVWAAGAGVSALAPVDVSDFIARPDATDIFDATPAYYRAADDHPPRCAAAEGAPPAVGSRQALRANAAGGATQALLSYCPGTHAALYDRPSVVTARYDFYPDAPFPHGSEALFPHLDESLPVTNPHYLAREAAVEFFLSAMVDGVPIALAPAAGSQLDDLDSDGEEEASDSCPLGSNPIWWGEAGAECQP